MRFNIFSPTISHSEARRLTALFMDGQTTLEQEKMLYRYFVKGSVADELQEYRTMFLLLGDADGKEAGRGVQRRQFARWFAVAASVALVFTIGFALLAPGKEAVDSDSFAQVYGGSYVVRNGKRITDPAIIEREVRLAEEYMLAQDLLLENYLNSFDEIEQAVIEEVYPSPKTRELIIRTLNQ